MSASSGISRFSDGRSKNSRSPSITISVLDRPVASDNCSIFSSISTGHRNEINGVLAMCYTVFTT
nr:hypothetical 6.8K protein - Synechococcus sp [Synechococcus sp.]